MHQHQNVVLGKIIQLPYKYNLRCFVLISIYLNVRETGPKGNLWWGAMISAPPTPTPHRDTTSESQVSQQLYLCEKIKIIKCFNDLS